MRNGGAIKLNREYWGVGVNYQIESKFKTQLGIDIGNQMTQEKDISTTLVLSKI